MKLILWAVVLLTLCPVMLHADPPGAGDPMLVDTTLSGLLGRMGTMFGLPVGWIGAGVLASIGIVNTLKNLAPTLIAGRWYPAVAAVISLGYAWTTLPHTVLSVLIGGGCLWITQWLGWKAAKTTAVTLNLREK